MVTVLLIAALVLMVEVVRRSFATRRAEALVPVRTTDRRRMRRR